MATERSRRPLIAALVVAAVLAGAAGAVAFNLIRTDSGTPVFWPGAQTTMNLRFGCPTNGPLPQYGPCWDDAASDALASWNAAVATFRFSQTSPSVAASPCQHSDPYNTAAWAPSACSMELGPDVLALTLSFFNPVTAQLVHADVLFNPRFSFSAYDGPLVRGVFDFHRVAVHEFGHVIGLAHVPQDSVSIMTPITSDIDRIQPDDVAGVNTLYPPVSGNCVCRDDVDNYCFYASGTPGCAMTARGGYCDPNGDGTNADADWLRGYVEFQNQCAGGGGTCECRDDVDNYCFYASRTPGCEMTFPGGYCDPNGDGSNADADWIRGYEEFQASCTGSGAVCACRSDVDNFCFYRSSTPGCPMTAPRGYCDPNGDGSNADADWVRGYVDFQQACR